MTDLTFSWSNIVNVIKTFGFVDFIDVLIVAFLFYKVLKFASNSRAGQLIRGIIIILLLYLFANAINLKTTTYIMEQVFNYGVIAIIVMFQPELRHALESMGKSKISKFNFLQDIIKPEKSSENSPVKESITRIVEGVSELSKYDVGALIVFERDVKLGEIISTGTIIDAQPSKEMLGNLFFHNAPLHDGAAIVRNGRIYAAGCFLPLSENYDISNMLGTRHRAALGMSENSDAVCIVVSEETGHISIAVNGKLTEHIDPISLKRRLIYYLVSSRNQTDGDPSEEGEKE